MPTNSLSPRGDDGTAKAEAGGVDREVAASPLINSKNHRPASDQIAHAHAGVECALGRALSLCLEKAEAANSAALDEHLRYVLKTEAELGRIREELKTLKAGAIL